MTDIGSRDSRCVWSIVFKTKETEQANVTLVMEKYLYEPSPPKFDLTVLTIQFYIILADPANSVPPNNQ